MDDIYSIDLMWKITFILGSDDEEDEDEEDWEGEGLGLEECLFCSSISSSLENNLNHMSVKHGFFLPDADYLTDVEGMMTYLGMNLKLLYVFIIVTFTILLDFYGSFWGRAYNTCRYTWSFIYCNDFCQCCTNFFILIYYRVIRSSDCGYVFYTYYI